MDAPSGNLTSPTSTPMRCANDAACFHICNAVIDGCVHSPGEEREHNYGQVKQEEKGIY